MAEFHLAPHSLSYLLVVVLATTSTDLVSKEAALQLDLGGTTVHIGGMCKGSGMIHPNMATMLGIVTCDAAVEAGVWRGMLRRACDASFNAVGTKDGWCVSLCCPGVAIQCLSIGQGT